MGIGARRPPLPAATDSLVDSAGDDSPTEQDLATDLSRRSDQTHHTIPDDGTPITIPTTLPRGIARQGNPAQQSQASLLIEYFENHSDSERKPSIRVRLAPSRSKSGNRAKSASPVPTRTPSNKHSVPLRSLSSDTSAFLPMATQRLSRPFEPEFQHTSEISALSDSPPARYIVPESDVSSMPADSMLGFPNPEPTRADLSGKENLRPPLFPTDRNVSGERLTQKVMEKLAAKPRTVASKSMPSRNKTSISRDVESGHPRRRAAKNIDEDSMTGTGSSLVSASMISADHKSVDQRSARSGHSQVSINNPKLLQTVEDAIRRLILPELKEIKKDQRHSSHRRPKEYPSDLSESSVSREEVSRRKSSGGKSRRRSSGKEHSSHRVSSGSRRHREERPQKLLDYESPSERSYQQSESISSMSIEDDPEARKHRKSHRARDAAAGAAAGAALTAAALKSHDSGSSLDHRERRKKRSKSRSTRTESVAEDDAIFQKHNVPPMPMRSDLDSELTRSSLLSSNTAGTTTPTRREVRRVMHGSPNALQSPVSSTASRTPVEKQKGSLEKSPGVARTGLGMHHGNFSEQDLAGSREVVDQDDEDDDGQQPFSAGYGRFSQDLLTDPERAKAYERNLHHQHPIRRGLSPIQSVASYATTEPNRMSMVHPRSHETLSSPQEPVQDDISEASFSSVNSIDAAKGLRPHGVSLENRSEILRPHEAHARGVDIGGIDSPEADYRNSFASSDAKVPVQARSTFTEDSLDEPYIDKVTAGQQVAFGLGAIPRYVDSPDGVESAVASLCEPSVLESRGPPSPRGSQSGSPGNIAAGAARAMAGYRSGSPLKQNTAASDLEYAAPHGIEPPVMFSRSRQHSTEQIGQPHSPSANPTSDAQDTNSPESEITTNPSVIQGPIAGYTPRDTSHWPYGPTPPPGESNVPSTSRDLPLTAPELVPEPLSMGHGPGQKTDIYTGRAAELTPPGVKDEGYETGANAPSPAIIPTQQRSVPRGLPFSQELAYEDDLDDDPFTTGKRDQYVSGLSHGMSPLYDNATGKAADRIYDKDIRALMDHLTVRDAQRNARDTEMLITLVRTAADMRNSFEDLKKIMADQGETFLEESNKQHERTQKVIGGPRPQPVSRNARTPASEDEDLPTKRRNMFRRALGLGNKNTQELQNIEGMVMQLLDEVEGLRALHTTGPNNNDPRSNSAQSADNGRAPTDTGYEPEGQAGTSSTGDRSGIYSNDSSRQADYRGYNLRQDGGNRVSTVMERDEEYYDDDYTAEQQQTPKATARNDYTRVSSEPVHTPPRMHDANQGTQSHDNTPRASNESSSGGRKHKSFASSFLPKMVSRWSKTTASSDYRASTQTKARPYSQHSQSGSNLEGYDYDPQGGDAIRSNMSLENEQYRNENRPPSPLIPSQVSDSHPKYQGYRNSINLQHPQPRQGPTGRFHNQLESEAQYYTNDPTSPTSVTSSQWEAQAALAGMPGASDMHGGYQHGGQLSPISDRGESMSQRSTSSMTRGGPPHPPKVPEDDPLMPPRPPKVVMSPPASRQSTYVDHVAAARAGSPAFDKSPVAALRTSPGGVQIRKPSGPRPYNGDMNAVKKTRFRGSPNQIDSDDDLNQY